MDAGLAFRPVRWILSRTPWDMCALTPEKGEHTDAVLNALGYDAAAIAGLRARGAIWSAPVRGIRNGRNCRGKMWGLDANRCSAPGLLVSLHPS